MGNPKEMMFNEQVLKSLQKGINELADVVAVTLGPNGRNVAITSWAKSKITNDGNYLANELELKNDFENMGVKLVKELFKKNELKDGTTTAIIILRSIVNDAIKNITSGISSVAIKKGLEKALKVVLEQLDKASEKIKTQEDIKNIAIASASFDEKIGLDIAKALKLAKEDHVMIETGKKNEIEIEVIEGMQIERGFLSSYFCNDLKKQRCVLNNPKILVTDKKISSIQDILPLLKLAKTKKFELMIFANHIEKDVLATLVVNNLKKIVTLAAVKTPPLGEERKYLLEDIACLTSANFISEEKGLLLKDIIFEDLGTSKHIVIDKEKTTIIEGKKNNVDKRIESLEKLADSVGDLEKQRIERRISKLKGKIVVVRVGGNSSTEVLEKKQKYEDSLNSTKLAISDGVVPGGGVTLLKIGKKLDFLKLDYEEKIGANILKKALFAPIKQLIANSGLDYPLIIKEILEKENGYGFNVVTQKIEDFKKVKIFDPTKIIKIYLQNSVSLASMIITSDVLIFEN